MNDWKRRLIQVSWEKLRFKIALSKEKCKSESK